MWLPPYAFHRHSTMFVSDVSASYCIILDRHTSTCSLSDLSNREEPVGEQSNAKKRSTTAVTYQLYCSTDPTNAGAHAVVTPAAMRSRDLKANVENLNMLHCTGIYFGVITHAKLHNRLVDLRCNAGFRRWRSPHSKRVLGLKTSVVTLPANISFGASNGQIIVVFHQEDGNFTLDILIKKIEILRLATQYRKGKHYAPSRTSTWRLQQYHALFLSHLNPSLQQVRYRKRA